MNEDQSPEATLQVLSGKYDRLTGFLAVAVVAIVLLLAVLSTQSTELWRELSRIWSWTFMVLFAFVGIFPLSYIAYQIRRKEIKICRLSYEFKLLGLIKRGEEDTVRQLYDRAYNWGQYVLYISLIIVVSVIIFLMYAPLSPLSATAVGSETTTGLPVAQPTAASPGTAGTATNASLVLPIKAATNVTTMAAISPTQPITLVESIATSQAITSTRSITLTSTLTTSVVISPAQSVTLTSTMTTAVPLPSQPIIPANRHVVSLVFFGFLGAYIYSVTELVRRYNTFDLQPQVYASILVRMVAAVVLVFVGALTIFNAPSTYQPPSAAPGYATIWLPAIVAFVIGAFPSRGLDWFRRLAEPVLTGRSAVTPSALPIENLLGVSTWHASRLEQIGIDDAQNLAGADLAELLLTTQFDAQVIVNWVDQAILYVKVGSDIEKYRKKNIPSFTALKRTVLEYDQLDDSLNTLAVQLGLTGFAELKRLADDAGFPNYYNLEAYYSRAPLVTSSFAQDAQDEIIGQAQFRNFDEAIKVGNSILEFHTGTPDVGLLRTLGTAYWQRALGRKKRGENDKAAKDFETAINQFDQALKQEPTSAEAHYGRGLCLLETQKWQEAVNSATRAITYDRGFAEAFNVRATAFMKLGNLDLAKQNLDEALRLDDRLAEAYYNRGILLADGTWAGADCAQAKTDFEKAYYSRYEDKGGIKLGLGKAHFGLDDLEGAAQNLTEAIGMLEEYRLPEAYLTRSKVYRKQGQIDDALTDLDWIINREKLDDHWLTEARYARAIIYLEQGRRDEAKADSEWIVNRADKFSSELTKRAYRILVALQGA